tara:strand:- start:140 stop:298 length:159 start_codon:yes stop_codon:yes gene_type:complete
MLKQNTKLQPKDIKAMNGVLSYIPASLQKTENKEKSKPDIEKIFNKKSSKKK